MSSLRSGFLSGKANFLLERITVPTLSVAFARSAVRVTSEIRNSNAHLPLFQLILLSQTVFQLGFE